MNNSKTPYQPSSDKALRTRVKLFGTLLGEILREHAGHKVFSTVERLRRGYISVRKKENLMKRRRLSQVIEKNLFLNKSFVPFIPTSALPISPKNPLNTINAENTFNQTSRYGEAPLKVPFDHFSSVASQPKNSNTC